MILYINIKPTENTYTISCAFRALLENYLHYFGGTGTGKLPCNIFITVNGNDI